MDAPGSGNPGRGGTSATGHLLVEEEQVALLGKLLLYAVDHMTAREKYVYDLLVEELAKRVNRSKRQDHMPGHGVPPGQAQTARRHPKHGTLAMAPPQEIVRVFVESWNYQDFETEYECLSPSCLKGSRRTSSLSHYLMQRQAKYDTREITGMLSKRVDDVSGADVHGNRATIECMEFQEGMHDDKILRRRYDLIKEADGWRIIDFETIKETVRPRTA